MQTESNCLKAEISSLAAQNKQLERELARWNAEIESDTRRLDLVIHILRQLTEYQKSVEKPLRAMCGREGAV